MPKILDFPHFTSAEVFAIVVAIKDLIGRIKEMKTTAKTAFALLAVLAASTLWAVEVTSEQAKTAVANWISASSTRLEPQFKSRQAEASKTHKTAPSTTR